MSSMYRVPGFYCRVGLGTGRFVWKFDSVLANPGSFHLLAVSARPVAKQQTLSGYNQMEHSYPQTEEVSAEYAKTGYANGSFMQPGWEAALNDLKLAPGSTGLDAGCGPGELFGGFSWLIGDTGKLIGVDSSSTNLELAHLQIERHGLKRVTVLLADLAGPLPFKDQSFDWVWCADVLWQPLDELAVIGEFKRILRPGGTLALFYGNYFRASLLPGYSRLEHKLLVAEEARWWDSAGQPRETARRHYEGAVGWLAESGLEKLCQKVYSVSYGSPLSSPVLNYLTQLLTNFYGSITDEQQAEQAGLTRQEWQTWQEISNPASPHFVLAQPHYYCQLWTQLITGQLLA